MSRYESRECRYRFGKSREIYSRLVSDSILLFSRFRGSGAAQFSSIDLGRVAARRLDPLRYVLPIPINPLRSIERERSLDLSDPTHAISARLLL